MSDETPDETSIACTSIPRLNKRIWIAAFIGFLTGFISQGVFWALENAEIGSEWFPSLWFFMVGLIFGTIGVNGIGLFLGVIVGYVLVFVPFFVNDSLFPAIVIISVCVTSTAPLGWLISRTLIHLLGGSSRV